MYPATDLDGNPRIIGDSVDVGAYEYTPSFWCSFYADPALALIDESIQFISAVSGPDPSVVYFWWDFQNDGTWDTQGRGIHSPTWQYPAEGLYTVALMISNQNNLVASSTRLNYIDVLPEPGIMSIIISVIGLLFLRRTS